MSKLTTILGGALFVMCIYYFMLLYKNNSNKLYINLPNNDFQAGKQSRLFYLSYFPLLYIVHIIK